MHVCMYVTHSKYITCVCMHRRFNAYERKIPQMETEKQLRELETFLNVHPFVSRWIIQQNHDDHHRQLKHRLLLLLVHSTSAAETAVLVAGGSREMTMTVTDNQTDRQIERPVFHRNYSSIRHLTFLPHIFYSIETELIPYRNRITSNSTTQRIPVVTRTASII